MVECIFLHINKIVDVNRISRLRAREHRFHDINVGDEQQFAIKGFAYCVRVLEARLNFGHFWLLFSRHFRANYCVAFQMPLEAAF